MTKKVTLTQKDIREMTRILAGHDREIQEMREERQSGGVPQLVRDVIENAIADDSVTVEVINDPTMVWDDSARGYDYAEWVE